MRTRSMNSPTTSFNHHPLVFHLACQNRIVVAQFQNFSPKPHPLFVQMHSPTATTTMPALLHHLSPSPLSFHMGCVCKAAMVAAREAGVVRVVGCTHGSRNEGRTKMRAGE